MLSCYLSSSLWDIDSECLLSLVVVRTMQSSEWTSIGYVTADSIPAIVPCTAVGRRHSMPPVVGLRLGQ